VELGPFPILPLTKVIITFSFCCDDLWKSKFMALGKPGKLREFFLLLCGYLLSGGLYSVKGKGPVLDITLLHDEHVLRSALQSRKWQLIGMS